MFLIFMFLMGFSIIMFCLVHKHLLQTLLSLEFLVLILFLMMFFMIMILGYELNFILFFLVFTVCEGALGLSILVNLVRNQGNDYLFSSSIMSW
uniref:NADH dehydrogenase subunit 4L n=1 Tax=Urochelellus acutihumeralis TaxID=3020186 RepID=UPI002410FBB3|nr:NADH dehydrogenase subunit 4L [Urochelellus acutihumeralis]WEM32433.1 NADH dehydrogenase subunit 4L [Urochelellus acutihumeralis]